MIPGSPALLRLSNFNSNAFINQIFKSITFSNGLIFPGGHFLAMKALLTTVNTVTMEAIVYPINEDGIDQ